MQSHSSSSNLKSTNAINWLFALTLIGYPVAGLASSFFDWDSTVTSHPFRIGVIALSILILLQPGVRSAIRPSAQWLVLFLCIYFARLIYDWQIAEVPGSKAALIFFLLASLIPCLALAHASPIYGDRSLARLLVCVGTAICIAASATALFKIANERSLTEVTSRLSFEALNPISLGHVATTTIIALLCLSRFPNRLVVKLAMLTAATAALTCLLLSASRGPVVALAAATITFTIATGLWRWIFVLFILLLLILNNDSELSLRFSTFSSDASVSERLLIQANSIDQFLKHPFFGSAFIELETLTYPHNILIESAMALGVFGAVLLLYVLYLCAVRARRQSRSGNLTIPLLYVQYLVASLTSSSIYGSSGLWAICTILLFSDLPALSAQDTNPSPEDLTDGNIAFESG